MKKIKILMTLVAFLSFNSGVFARNHFFICSDQNQNFREDLSLSIDINRSILFTNYFGSDYLSKGQPIVYRDVYTFSAFNHIKITDRQFKVKFERSFKRDDKSIKLLIGNIDDFDEPSKLVFNGLCYETDSL